MEQSSRIQPKQLIDQHKNFNRQAIQRLQAALPNVQKDYQSVAIIGVQNSGKSTLLNHLFGTNFEVLQKVAGERTTCGIWTSLDKEANIIVFDVEGNDAAKRSNEPQYEKMVSTFALVQADTLIINVWAKTLGQYTGSQYETLNAVMDICISQFKQQSPKTLLFCIRDFNQEEDEQGQLRRKVIKDVTNIWNKIQKPTEIAKYQQTPQKFFVIQVAVLRKYKKQNPKYFVEDVKKLRQRFINPKNDGYVFKAKKLSYNLPLKDLPQLAENSWKSITTNKKLNLPHEKQQLSNFRCSQILKQQIRAFQTQIDQIQKNKVPVDFGRILEHYVKQFQVKTYNYGKNIVQEKQKSLKSQINDTIKKVINEIINSQQKKLKQQFRKLSAFVNPQNSLTLQSKLVQLKNQTIENYSQIYRTFNYQIQQRKQRIQQLNIFLNKQNSQSLVKNKQIINAEFQKQCSRQIRLLSTQLLKKYFGLNFWVNVQKQYIQKRNQLIKSYQKSVLWAQNRVLQPSQFDSIDQKLSSQLKDVIREQLKKNLMAKAFDIFIRQFTKNKEGVPFNFNILQIKKIAELYDNARDNARDLIQKINLYNVRRSQKSSILQFEQDQKDQFFESTWLSASLSQLDKKMISEHETIVRRKKEEQMRRVPIWLYVIILYFVYDDLWFSQETHPITNKVLTCFLIFAAFFFSIGQHRALMELWNFALDGGKDLIQKARKRFGI